MQNVSLGLRYMFCVWIDSFKFDILTDSWIRESVEWFRYIKCWFLKEIDPDKQMVGKEGRNKQKKMPLHTGLYSKHSDNSLGSFKALKSNQESLSWIPNYLTNREPVRWRGERALQWSNLHTYDSLHRCIKVYRNPEKMIDHYVPD